MTPLWYTPLSLNHASGSPYSSAMTIGFAGAEVVMGVLMIFLIGVALLRRFAQV